MCPAGKVPAGRRVAGAGGPAEPRSIPGSRLRLGGGDVQAHKVAATP